MVLSFASQALPEGESEPLKSAVIVVRAMPFSLAASCW